MNFFSLLKLTQNKQDYFKYFILFLFLVITINNFPNLFTYRFALSFIISIFIIFIYIKYNANLIMDNFKMFKNKLYTIDNNNLKFLNNDIEILTIYSDIINLKKFNESAFNNSLRNINQFLKLYVFTNNSTNLHKNIYDNAIDRRNKAINELMSIIISMQPSIENQEDNDNKLQNQVNKLRNLTGEYIVKISRKINYYWKTKKPNIYTKPIYIDKIVSNPYSDILFSNKFNIY